MRAPGGSITATKPRSASCSPSTSLILDDFALDTLDPTESRDLYEILTDRHRAGSSLPSERLVCKFV
jgi:hypothetical protein